MQLRSLGRTGIQVSPLMLGGNVFGWTANEATSFDILDAFVAAGGNFVDTADVYSAWAPGHKGGESETVIGNWFKRSGKRSQIVMATKVGFPLSPDKKGLSAAYIERAVEDSLRRLQTDYIDVYFSHTDDAGVPLEETLRAYQHLIEKGKVRVIGASNYTAARLSEALRTSHELTLPSYQVLQPQYNLYDRVQYEAELENVCIEHGLGVVVYFALARGFLSGKYRTDADLKKSPRGGSVKANYFNPRGERILDALNVVAIGLSATPAQVALAWIMARKSVTAPIASTTSVAQVNELVGAMSLQLSKATVEQLNKASAA
jgi:aryl-alcohol dehydrogenase-like predicted oxidoreductase